MDMNWKFFIGSSILGAGLLLKMGAPLVPVALGLVLAAFVSWKRHRSATTPRPRKS